MKQFMCTMPTGQLRGPFDEGLALSTVSTATDSLLVQWCPVGGTFEDSDGFVWERIE